MKKVLIILGPTASGKSRLAVKLAKKFKGEIISADSRQVYKGLNVGTGKITKREMQGIPHHLLDVADPKKQFTVAQYKALAEKKLSLIDLPVVVGGTGFYIDALTGVTSFPDVPPDKLLRRKLNKLDKEELFKVLKKKDPKRAKNIDANNKVRLIRALEIVATLGKVPPLGNPVSKWHSKWQFIYVGLRPNDLDKRIYKRLIKRIPGIIREARKLSKKRAHELGLEYRFASLYLQGKLNRSEMIEQLNTAIRQYAKRQMTWFKRNKKIRWFMPDEYKRIERYIKTKL